MALLKKQSPFVVRLFFSFHTMHHLFLVMEYVPGSDCAAMLRTYGPLPEGEGGREGGRAREGGTEEGRDGPREGGTEEG